MTATNQAGYTSPASAPSGAVTPVASVTAPVAPTGVWASAGDASAAVNFSAPWNSGGTGLVIASYTVTSSPGNITATGAASPINVTGLTNGTAYTFTVTANNQAGFTSSASAASNAVAPAGAAGGAPGQPSIYWLEPGDASVKVHFGAHWDNGGSAITGFTVKSTPGNITATGNSSPINVTGLANGTSYTFTVTTTNQAGYTSVPSNPSSAATPVSSVTAPVAPTGVWASPGNASATVNFSAPWNNGGSPIASYTVTSSPGGITASGAGTSINVSGLSNGTAYTFTVTATNQAGYTSAASAPSGTVTPNP